VKPWYIARRCTALGGAVDLELLALGKSWKIIVK